MKALAAIFLFMVAASGVDVTPLLPLDASALVEGKRIGIVIGIW